MYVTAPKFIHLEEWDKVLVIYLLFSFNMIKSTEPYLNMNPHDQHLYTVIILLWLILNKLM